MSPLSVGIVGAGHIAQLRHVPAYQENDNIELKAICDQDKTIADEAADEYSIGSYYGLKEMLDAEDLDIVDICVPPSAHADVAMAAMEYGCHILVEKPMALTTEECRDMMDSAETNDVKLSVMHNQRFHPPVREAKNAIKNGAIGDVVGMRTLQVSPHEEMIEDADHWYHELPGGVIGETFPHTSYLTLDFLEEIDEINVYAESKLGREWAPHDEFRIEMVGPNGMNSAILSYSTNYSAAQIDILGTEAALRLDLLNMRVIRYGLPDMGYVTLGMESVRDILQRVKALVSNASGVVTDGKPIGTEVVINRFIQSIRQNSEPPVTPNEGARVVELVEKAVESYQEKVERTPRTE